MSVDQVSAKCDDERSLLYLAARMPELTETFVYRELFGLRKRGVDVIAGSVRPPAHFVDEALGPLSDQTFIVYAPATLAALPLALALHPALALGALLDAVRADHSSVTSRLKHVLQAMMGIAAGWRLRGRRIKHVHVHMAHVPATVGLYLARTVGARFSFTGHAADLFVDRAALRFKLDRAAFVACISHWHRGFYSNVAALPADRLPIIRCSVALPDAIRPESTEIVTVARLVPKKGIDLLIGAFAAADVGDWTLRILGDGPERDALEALAAQLGVANRITFEGARPHAACLAAIAEAGLFVLQCRTAANGDMDGIPVVLMEAMAAGRAVVAGDLPAIRELIDHDHSGLLVTPNDPAALAQAFQRLIADPALRRKFAERARSRIEMEFSDSVNLDRLVAVFKHVKAIA